MEETVCLNFERYGNDLFLFEVEYVGASIKPNIANLNLSRACKELTLQNSPFTFYVFNIGF